MNVTCDNDIKNMDIGSSKLKLFPVKVKLLIYVHL